MHDWKSQLPPTMSVEGSVLLMSSLPSGSRPLIPCVFMCSSEPYASISGDHENRTVALVVQPSGTGEGGGGGGNGAGGVQLRPLMQAVMRPTER